MALSCPCRVPGHPFPLFKMHLTLCITANRVRNEQLGHMPETPGHWGAAAKGICRAGERQAAGTLPWQLQASGSSAIIWRILRCFRSKNTIFLVAWGNSRSLPSRLQTAEMQYLCVSLKQGIAPSKAKYRWNSMIDLKLSFKLSQILI